jgi:hypothetical protein
MGTLGLLLTSCGGQVQTAVAPAPRTPLVTAPVRAEPATPTVTAAAPPAPPATTEALQAEEARTPSVPTTCEPGVEPCSTPAKFVERVCRGKYPELALVLLAKGTPWRRGYVKAETVEPVNTYDGERSEEWLRFGEEVLVLRTRGPGSGHGSIQMSGPTDVDILRWDGTCATIRQEMLAPHATDTRLLAARVAWKYLDTPIQEALLKNPVVQLYSEKERPACRGSTMKHPDERCDKASRKLTDAIAVAVRGGITLPTPAKVPSWAD